MKVIKIGTRDSVLALAQTALVAESIRRFDSGIEVQVVPMKTTGDKRLDVTLDKIGGKGLFTKELDEALLNGTVDLTVHSYKDMPLEIHPQLPIVALSEREDVRDVLIMRSQNPPEIKVVGSASPRRKVQLESMGYISVEPIRGNLQTRLKKLDNGEFDAIVLAAAGIKRLGLENRISRYFHPEELLPAASQGIIAVQSRIGEDVSFLKAFNSEESYWVSLAERSFLAALNGGCSSPVAAYAQISEGKMRLMGMYVDDMGRIHKGASQGIFTESESLGRTLAEKLKGVSECHG